VHDLHDGSILHHVSLKKTVWQPVAILLSDDEKIAFVAVNGHISAFELPDLTELWDNNLEGLGYDSCHSLKFSSKYNLLIDAFNGFIVALSPVSGHVVWKEAFSKARPKLTVTLLDEDVAVVGGVGHIRAIWVETGKEIWYNALEGLRLAPVTIAAAGGDFCNSNGPCTLFQAIDAERKNYH
jgi:outer membrane protein assembly factor BamB